MCVGGGGGGTCRGTRDRLGPFADQYNDLDTKNGRKKGRLGFGGMGYDCGLHNMKYTHNKKYIYS